MSEIENKGTFGEYPVWIDIDKAFINIISFVFDEKGDSKECQKN